jgi:hypothetical protein
VKALDSAGRQFSIDRKASRQFACASAGEPAMPREGSQTLSDLRSQVLRIACDRCGRSGRYNAARLWRERGDLKVTDFLAELTADCRRKGPAIYDRCDARFEF